MAKTREQKEQTVSDLTAAFKSSKLAVLTDYRGLNVPAISELRSNLREVGISYTVAKNTLVKIALAAAEVVRFLLVEPNHEAVIPQLALLIVDVIEQLLAHLLGRELGAHIVVVIEAQPHLLEQEVNLLGRLHGADRLNLIRGGRESGEREK